MGTGRSGTTYVASLLNQMGCRCSHEEIYTAYGVYPDKWGEFDAACSFVAPYETCSIPKGSLIIHVTRNPLDILKSQMSSMGDTQPFWFSTCEDPLVGPFIKYIHSKEPEIFLNTTLLDRASDFIVRWSNTCDKVSSMRLKLEELNSDKLKSVIDWLPLFDAKVPSTINTREHKYDYLTWDIVSSYDKGIALRNLAEEYGYI